jgi:Glucose-6-phosphate dehydrogenase, NAD binding domain
MDQNEYLKRVKSYIKTPTKDIEEHLESFCEACTYISGQYDQDEPFQQLDKHLSEFEENRKEGNRVFYMALPPSVFIPVSQHLKKHCYPKNGIARVIVSNMPVWPTELISAGRETVRQGLGQLARASESSRTRLEGRRNLPHRPLPW